MERVLAAADLLMGTEQQSVRAVQNDEIDFLRLYGVIWRGRKFILIRTATVAVLVVTYAILTARLPPDKSPLPNVYKPEALLLVNDNGSSGLSSALSSSGHGNLASLAGVSTGGTYGALAVRLLQSGTILDPIATEFHIAQRYHIRRSVIDSSRGALLTFDTKTGTVNVSYQDCDPKFATELVNRMVELLQAQFSDIGGNRNITRKELLEQKLVHVKAQIDRLSVEVAAFQRTHDFLTVSSLATEQVMILRSPAYARSGITWRNS